MALVETFMNTCLRPRKFQTNRMNFWYTMNNQMEGKSHTAINYCDSGNIFIPTY